MRMTSLAAASVAGLAVLLGTAPAAQAQTQAQQQERGVIEQQVPVAGISCTRTEPPQRVAPSAEVLDAIDGAYRLSNGQKLELGSIDQAVVADFGRRHQVPLVATAPDRFESRNGLVWVRYEADEREERIVVSYPADPRGRYVSVC